MMSRLKCKKKAPVMCRNVPIFVLCLGECYQKVNFVVHYLQCLIKIWDLDKVRADQT